jgi:choline dehydrogenase
MTHSQVTCININDNKKATGINFIRHGRLETITAKCEVILSTGAIQSPQLLELSGIGQPERLLAHGIKVNNVRTPVEYCTT